jgi:hypothetical protein
MTRVDEIEKPESCFNKADKYERMFILLARDASAPVAIKAWVVDRLITGKNKIEDSQIVEALECARLMQEERLKEMICQEINELKRQNKSLLADKLELLKLEDQ